MEEVATNKHNTQKKIEHISFSDVTNRSFAGDRCRLSRHVAADDVEVDGNDLWSEQRGLRLLCGRVAALFFCPALFLALEQLLRRDVRAQRRARRLLPRGTEREHSSAARRQRREGWEHLLALFLCCLLICQAQDTAQKKQSEMVEAGRARLCVLKGAKHEAVCTVRRAPEMAEILAPFWTQHEAKTDDVTKIVHLRKEEHAVKPIIALPHVE
jgi:hypothetical protein